MTRQHKLDKAIGSLVPKLRLGNALPAKWNILLFWTAVFFWNSVEFSVQITRQVMKSVSPLFPYDHRTPKHPTV